MLIDEDRSAGGGLAARCGHARRMRAIPRQAFGDVIGGAASATQLVADPKVESGINLRWTVLPIERIAANQSGDSRDTLINHGGAPERLMNTAGENCALPALRTHK